MVTVFKSLFLNLLKLAYFLGPVEYFCPLGVDFILLCVLESDKYNKIVPFTSTNPT